jgi:hypothetical protein
VGDIIEGFKKLTRFQKGVIVLSLILLFISITQPAFFIDRPEDPEAWSDSWIIFFFGWTFFLGGSFSGTFIWLANPIYFTSLIFIFDHKPKGIYLSVLATLIALLFSTFDTVITSESGSYSAITSFGLGYKLWVSSFITLTVGSIINEVYYKDEVVK